MTVDVEQFHQVFFEESLEHLANMEAALLQLEGGDADSEVVNVIFRGAHSIKGGGATFGFSAIAEFTHLVETLLERVRAGQMPITPEVIALLLGAVDMLRDMIATLQNGEEVDIERCETLKQQLSAILAHDVSAIAEPIHAATVVGSDELPLENGWHILFKPHRGFFMTGNDPYRILRELAELGQLELTADDSALPAFADMDPEQCYLAWDMVLHGPIARDVIDDIFAWVEGDCDLEIQSLQSTDQVENSAPPGVAVVPARPILAAEPADRRTGADRRQGDRRQSEGESIRVGIEKIDAIINLVGELVITQSMLSQMGDTLSDMGGAALENLRDGLAQLERNTRELQEGVMRIRMLPISFAFSRFPRLVHDLSSRLGKKVELKLSGEQTELDKTVMEKIGDPLVHLVRNALDHGIESPDVRRAQGKSEVGSIQLHAYHQGGNVIIEISDDGAGLNLERIAAKACEKGLLAADTELDSERAAELIFDPGFSTAETVSEVSGRGVGMDVVRRNIRDLGGNVEISSQPGLGSRFTIRLPLTLAILDGQLVRIGGQVYIIPLVSIVESLQVRPERINVLAGCAKVYRLRNDYIPVMDLHQTFASGTVGSVEGLLVVVEAEGRKVGLAVDELLGQQQVVIKSLESNFRPVPGISGATILGDGTVALILDAGQLVHVACDTPEVRAVLNKATAAA